MSANPPADWYPDPHGEAELRYWDGNTWTEHTSGDAPGAGATQIDQQQAAPEPAAQAQGPLGFQDQGGTGYGGGAGAGRSGPPKGLLIGLGALAALAALVGILFLAGVLGGSDDEDDPKADVRAAVEDVLENPDDPDICDNFADEFLEDLDGGKSACETEVEGNEDVDFDDIEDDAISVDGDEAEVEVSIDGEETAIDLIKDGDDWKVNDLIAGVCCVGSLATTGTDTGLDTGTDTGTDTGATPSGAEAEVREVVEEWLTAVSTNDGETFCRVTTYKFARDRGVRGSDDQVLERCPRQADRMIDELIIASDPDIESVELTGGTDFQTATVTLTDTSVIEVVGEPGNFWLIDTFV